MERNTLLERLERILPTVEKPGRYVGGELNQIYKEWNSVKTHVALAFPDIYDIGVPNLGLTILYHILNERPDVLAERVYLPWVDMEAAMRREGLPLYALESKTPVKQFDILGITLPYETLYTNVLNLLDLAGIPLRSSERTINDPLVIAGGHAVFNPEPIAPFFDAIVIGEGEEIILEIINAYQEWKTASSPRVNLLAELAKIEGIYIPSFYEPEYHEDGTIRSIHSLHPNASLQIKKRLVAQLPKPPTRFIVPSIGVVHNRVSVEIMRGCTRGCRFCHAGMVTRPVRERSVDEIVSAVREALDATGFEEVALLSLSSSDYTHILDLVSRVADETSEHYLTISLPSLRIESFSVKLMEKLRGSRQGGFTLAPEAATERMRNIINKPISTRQLLDTAREIYSRGWTNIKLYFMIGHPSETIADVQAIADLCKDVLAEGRKVIGKRATLHAGVSTFVPKPHTPFQWVACDTLDQIEAKQSLLKRELRGPGLKLTWNNPHETLMEAWLSRGDRRLANVIETAWRLGAKFDAWQDQFNFEIWQKAFSIHRLDPSFYTHRQRAEDEIFPWDHIFTGVRKAYLLSEYRASLLEKTQNDCRQGCFACGILPKYADLRRNHPGNHWKCPEVPRRPVKVPMEQIA
ncbi:MAG: B12-binding domain-containing radical SAM protein [Bellilinea sp.]|nr:MAG: B12-binding domain-containing radical SAM protein [Bellilinea sp.]